MRKDAEAHADEDKARREEVETRNEADNTVYRTEKFLKENGDKVGAEKAKIEAAVTAIKEALKGSDTAAIRSALDQVNATMQVASAELYKNAQAKGEASKDGPAPGGETADAGPKAGDKKGDGPIIDAEVVDEKKG